MSFTLSCLFSFSLLQVRQKPVDAFERTYLKCRLNKTVGNFTVYFLCRCSCKLKTEEREEKKKTGSLLTEEKESGRGRFGKVLLP